MAPGEAAMRERGFTFIGVLLLVAVMGAVLASTATVWHTMNQRDKERELLFVGHEFRNAIGMYYERTPGGNKQYPKKLEDLLLDKRQVNIARYLRRLYPDPMTGKKEWGLVKGAGGVIMGVYSLSTETPVKTGKFDEVDKDFEGQASYAGWKFIYHPKQAANPAQPGVPGTPGLPGVPGAPGAQGTTGVTGTTGTTGPATSTSLDVVPTPPPAAPE